MSGSNLSPSVDQGKRITQDDIAALIAERANAPNAAMNPTATVDTQTSAETQPGPMENFVLYTRASCRGSTVIQKMIDPVREDFRVVDVDTLDRSTLPSWLDGTPILVDVRTAKRELYRGTDAAVTVQEVYPSVGASAETSGDPGEPSELDRLP